MASETYLNQTDNPENSVGSPQNIGQTSLANTGNPQTVGVSSINNTSTAVGIPLNLAVTTNSSTQPVNTTKPSHHHVSAAALIPAIVLVVLAVAVCAYIYVMSKKPKNL